MYDYYSLIFIILLILAVIWGIQEYRRRKREGDVVELTEDILKHFSHEEMGTYTRGEIESKVDAKPHHLSRALDYAEENGWIHSREGGSVTLTDTGLSYGRRISRSHRIIETYLAEKTGYPRSEWHRRAEALEHSLLPHEISRMARDLGHPIVDPNGEPIPTITGEMPRLEYVYMKDVKDGRFTIASLDDKMEELYRVLTEAGLHRGTPIYLTRKDGQALINAPLTATKIPHEWEGHIQLLPREGRMTLEECDTLWSLPAGVQATILGMDGHLVGERRRRLADLGFVKGGKVRLYMPGPMGKPRAYLIRDTAIALRQEQAEHILIQMEENNHAGAKA